ncbi:3-hydroxyacyl-CoA dehydrogenase [Staphylococcus warneri]|uniref:thioesterase family protein n=1 Tax=Staphylococcus warneri TaxID=1292 RepID=UPI000F544809|nr:thioesterase family protein [Staphylococcus warneri]MBE9429159.1 thioesterase family protein [Staphylococcus epidermidis]RQM99153.1 3-hydroxyacyl-CoA dehydrogenase [Staphylococcus warneri]
MSQTFTVSKTVTEDFIDHNNHMHDAYYNIIFSDVIDDFNYSHGLSLDKRAQYEYTTFTIEEHTSFLSELTLNEQYYVELYIYDYDYKRVHFFLRMIRQDGEVAATNEVMMMGIDQNKRRSAAFPEDYYQQIERYAQQEQLTIEWPKQLGHRIGIPHKGDQS